MSDIHGERHSTGPGPDREPFKGYGADPPYPIGAQTFLVYGECSVCGWCCALPEGSRWPDCPKGHGLVMPPGANEATRYAFRAFFLLEEDAMRLCKQEIEVGCLGIVVGVNRKALPMAVDWRGR